MLTQLNNRVQQLLEEVREDSDRKWGVMGPQHMVEHLGSVFLFSTGKLGIPFSGNAEEAAKHKAHFFSKAYPFPRKFTLPSEDPPVPDPLKTENLAAAKEVLKQEVKGFIDHYEQHPEQENPHPFFNILTYPEWLEFHVKHLEHHMMQFSILPIPEEVN